MQPQNSRFQRNLSILFLLFVLPILLIASLFYADWQWLKL